MLPRITGQGDQIGVIGQGLRGHAQFSHFVEHHLGHLSGRTLVHADIDQRVSGAQLSHRLGQHIPGLGVGGGNRQGATVLLAVFLANAFEVVHLGQDALNAVQHLLAGLGDAFEAFAVAGEDVDAQLMFQLQNGFGDAGLRGVQGFGRFGQIEVAAHRLLDKFELVQVHGGALAG